MSMKIPKNCPKMLDSFTSDTMLKDEVYVLYLQFIDTAMSIYMMLDVFTTRYKLGMRMAYIQMRYNVTLVTIHNGWSSWPATSIVHCL